MLWVLALHQQSAVPGINIIPYWMGSAVRLLQSPPASEKEPEPSALGDARCEVKQDLMEQGCNSLHARRRQREGRSCQTEPLLLRVAEQAQAVRGRAQDSGLSPPHRLLPLYDLLRDGLDHPALSGHLHALS